MEVLEMGGGSDVRDWDEDAYREGVLRERELHFRTVFRTAFAPYPDPSNPNALVAACSDGSVAVYSISACISSSHDKVPNHNLHQLSPYGIPFAKPLCYLQGHKGPAYDAKFYGEGEDSVLLSCGDDGRIYGWRWKEVVKSRFPSSINERPQPVLEFVNSQHKGPWNALSAIPENNAIDVNTQQGVVFSATGDACAYCWDMETGQKIMLFRGHSDYLHCIVACKLSNQRDSVLGPCVLNSKKIITGSEDGTARLWDCRIGKCIQVMHVENKSQSRESSWVSSVSIDSNEKWLACGSGNSLSVWSLPSCQCIWSVDSHVPVQDTLFDNNQVLAVGSEPALTRFNINGSILSRLQCAPPSVFSISQHPSRITAVGGYGGIVDVISEYGTHLCMFRCHGE